MPAEQAFWPGEEVCVADLSVGVATEIRAAYEHLLLARHAEQHLGRGPVRRECRACELRHECGSRREELRQGDRLATVPRCGPSQRLTRGQVGGDVAKLHVELHGRHT